MIERARLVARIKRALKRSPAVALVGPRQVGKTTLARQFLSHRSINYFDLESPPDRERLAQPLTTLQPLRGLVVIDEVQLAPEIFPVLRVIIDEKKRNGQFLLLGSASPRLLNQSGESLLGRMEVIEVSGFSLPEVGTELVDRLWLRGGYPRSFLSRSEVDSNDWRKNAVNRFVEQDLAQLGIGVAAPAMLRFWMMLAHYHGQVWNAADPARSLGVSEPTVRRYLDWLTQTFMVRQLQPWHENLGKRQIKSPKVYFSDSGLLHYLMGIRDRSALLSHPRSGASWEGFALQTVLHSVEPDAAYFWATQSGAELDLLMFKNGQRIGVEFKRSDAPKLTPSMRIAQHDLKLDHLHVVYSGTHQIPIAVGINATPLSMFVAGKVH